MSVSQVDATGGIVGQGIAGECGGVGIPVDDNSPADRLLQHVSSNNGSHHFFNDDSGAEVIIQIVARHGEVEPVATAKAIEVFLEVVGGDDGVVIVHVEIESGSFVVGDHAVVNAGVLEAAFHVDAVGAMFADGERA